MWRIEDYIATRTGRQGIPCRGGEELEITAVLVRERLVEPPPRLATVGSFFENRWPKRRDNTVLLSAKYY